MKITLIGAGPGAADLLTLRGLKALKSANIVLYDALLGEDLLELIPASIPMIYVGKRAGKHVCAQDEINKMLVEYALLYGHVVRLKGGDSFVFGRGMEELLYAHERGIETEVIPGVTSALSVPALQGIPVTHRAVSESFWVITGTTRNGKLSKDVEIAAKTTATTIIMMGMHKLSEIVQVYEGENKHELSVAIIQNGTLPNEQIVVSTIKDIEELAAEKRIGTPAVIVIGEVVSYHNLYKNTLRNYAIARS